MAKKDTLAKSNSDALATVDETAALAELADYFDDPDGGAVDGLEDFGGDDIKISTLLWNMRGKDKHGRSMTKDVYFDTVTEETSESIEVVMLTSKKTRRWDSFDNEKDKTIVHCQSRDNVTGTLANGDTRPCGGCPDYGWFTDEGKNKRRCGDVRNTLAIETSAHKPIMIRFKKTGLNPLRQYLSAYHHGARLAVNKKTGRTERRNVPLFAYAVHLSLKMSDNGMYATPVLEPVEQGRNAEGEPVYLLPTRQILDYAEAAKAWADQMDDALTVADAQTDAYGRDDDEGAGGALGADEFADD